MSSPKNAVIIASVLFMSNVNGLTAFAETLQKQTIPTANYTKSTGNTTTPIAAGQEYVVTTKGNINDVVLVQSISSEQYAALQENPELKKQVAPRQVIPLEQYKRLRGTQGLDKVQILRAVAVEDLQSAAGQKDLSKNGQTLSKQEVDANFAENGKDYVVIPEGQELSSEELAEIEGKVFWTPIAVGAAKGAAGGVLATGVRCQITNNCTWKDYAGGAAGGAVQGALGPAFGVYRAGQAYKLYRATWWAR